MSPLLLAENSLFKAVGDIFHPLFVAIAAVLAWIYGIVPNYAVAIVLLTLLIMALLTPLTIKSTRSMLAMQALQPEMQKLRQKYKGAENREQLNQELMALYREHGVSPTGGCLPMFLQMPALIVLYDVIRGLANTVKKNEKFGTGKRVCHQAICATPRYVPHNSAIYDNLKRTPGIMHSFGLNLAAKPLTHHNNWYDYVPYFVLLVIAVALQYFQMAQMTRRNKKNNAQQQIPQQMQTMQRVMPLIFAYIYFLVPAGVVIYMIVSSAIRVLTQDLIFRYGLVQAPGGERRLPAGKPAGASAAIPATSSVNVNGERTGAGPPANGKGAQQPAAGSQARAGQPRAGPRNRRRGPPQPPPPEPKPHPRSKSKRARKAR
jgi:YidC/Oxa1 family membrane protein insertase